MKALSVRAPWWWFILHAGKDIENRDWATDFRGTVYLHASQWWVRREIECILNELFEARRQSRRPVLCWPTVGEFLAQRDAGGCIVGKVDIVGCVRKSDSQWFFGRWGFVLANPVAFAKPIPCKGKLQFFTLPADVQASIREAEAKS